MMITRRALLEAASAGAAVAAVGGLPKLSEAEAAITELTPGVPAGVQGIAAMEALPGKKPLIRLADLPPNYAAPLEYFRTPITANDQFFVHYHLTHTHDVDLKTLPAAEVVAVNQCSGNRRGLSKPHVAGVEWGYGAMGCARWKGAKLKDVLNKVGLKKETIEVSFGGADGPVVDKTPDFIKSIPLSKAMDDATLIAYEMNGAPLPHFNGFPARIVVPGWTGTYWVKHVNKIDALTQPLKNFWMTAAYRIPIGMFPSGTRFTSQEYAPNTPITEMVVNSLITSHRDGAKIKAGKVTVSGIAWDGGYGIRRVEVSTDGGKTWRDATLGQDLGKYAFRPWSFDLAAKRGSNTVMVSAT